MIMRKWLLGSPGLRPFADSASRLLVRLMTMGKDRTTHLQLTANQPRHEVVAKATVAGLRMESLSVKVVTLTVESPSFTFKAGQWVDVFIPDMEEVGGFSIWTSPFRLETERLVDLAVKYSAYPPAQWIHKKCSVGTSLHVRSGGEFYYNPEQHSRPHNLLLIAGGVGVNPVASIFQHAADMQKVDQKNGTYPAKQVLLLYSARTVDELLFKDRFLAVSKEAPNLRCRFFVTRDKTPAPPNILLERTRIQYNHLQHAVKLMGKETTLCYVCGPTIMITEMEAMLKEIGLPTTNLFYEKWW